MLHEYLRRERCMNLFDFRLQYIYAKINIWYAYNNAIVSRKNRDIQRLIGDRNFLQYRTNCVSCIIHWTTSWYKKIVNYLENLRNRETVYREQNEFA